MAASVIINVEAITLPNGLGGRLVAGSNCVFFATSSASLVAKAAGIQR